MDRVDADRLHHRHQQRAEQEDRRQRIEKAANREQEDVDGEQQRPRRYVQRLQPRGHRGRHLVDGQKPREHAGAGHDDENLTREQHGRGGGFDDVAQCKLAEHDCGDERGVDAGDRGGFGRREHTAVDAAEDDDRGAQRPQAAAERGEEDFEPERLARPEVLAPRPKHDVEREHGRDHEARQHAGGIEARHRLLRRRAVHDHRDAGRDDHVDRADRGDEAGDERLRVAGAPHCRHHHLADGRHRGRAGAGNRAEDRGGADRGHAETAADRTDAALHEIDQALGDAAATHQLAGVDEERNGEQRKGVDGGEQDLLQRRERHVHEKHQRDGDSGQQNQEDREAEQQQRDRHHREGEGHGSAPRSGDRRVMRARPQSATTSMRAKPIATVAWGIHMGMPAMSLVRPIRHICRA